MSDQDKNIERSVLGAILLSDTAMTSISDKLRPEMFYHHPHGDIYAAMVDIYLSGSQPDIYTIPDVMTRMGKKHADVMFLLMDIQNEMGSSANVERHAFMILEKYMKREAVKIGHMIKSEAQDSEKDILEVLGQAVMSLEALTGNIATGQKSYYQIVQDTIARMKSAPEHQYMTGVPVYLTDVDRNTLGLQKTDLIIIAARPGMGKTAFIVQAAKRQAENNTPVGFFSLEMSSYQIAERILCNDLRIDIKTLKRGGLRREQWQRLDSRTEQIAGLPLYLCDKGALSLTEIVSIAKKWKAKHGIEILYIDYLQLITIPTAKGMNREREISTISARLKQLAKELDIPVVALSQLSRDVEKRGGAKKPILADLRDSGSIEQDADMVMFLYRAEYYGLTTGEDGQSTKDACELGIAKYRNGETGDIDLTFRGEYFRFGNKGESFDEPYDTGHHLTPMREAFEKDNYFNN